MLSNDVITTGGLRATMNRGCLQPRGLRTISTVQSTALVHSLICVSLVHHMQVNSPIFIDPVYFIFRRMGQAEPFGRRWTG